MYQYRLVHLSQFLRAFVKLPVINVAKIIIDATIAAGGDKALEADNAHFVQLMQPIQVIRDQTAQLRGVDGQFTFCRVKLEFNRLTIDRRRQLIERHLNHRGNTAFRRRARTGFIAFPVGTARFRNVGMRVNHARRNDQSRRIQHIFRFPQVLANRGDFSALDGDIDNSRFVF